ncbi:MAG: exodeoxyribonuclease VII small subunit [Alphaproteobacteria bacterium]|jgi:exodeoxyribonuclease VII small subunit|nr:exodeoxyribonuclease VII small subunit [Rickettsiales bacterium]
MVKPPSATPDAQSSLSFEQALKELEQIVRGLESGQMDLEKSIADYTRGVVLRDHCLKKLSEAKMRVEELTRAADGSQRLTPFAAKE